MAVTVPQTLEASITQAVEATRAAIAAGKSRLQVELAIPELKAMPVAEQFLRQYPDLASTVKVFFSDAGAAALARRDWEDISCSLHGLEELWDPVQSEDEAFLVVASTAVEIQQVEKICEQAGDRPFILLNPQLQDVAVIGIGVTGRQLRERFISTIEICYYLRPLEQGVLLRSFPKPWQLWWEQDSGEYELLGENETQPSSDRMAEMMEPLNQSAQAPKQGILQSLQQFINVLSR
ncbi:MAG: DUF1995 family protein [Thermosynechococcaceae cyanobacterium]